MVFLAFFICGFSFIPQITSGNPAESRQWNLLSGGYEHHSLLVVFLSSTVFVGVLIRGYIQTCPQVNQVCRLIDYLLGFASQNRKQCDILVRLIVL